MITSRVGHAEIQRILDEAQAPVVPDPAKALEGQAAAAIFGHLAADRVDAEAAELETMKSDILPVSGGSQLREASLRRSEAKAMRDSSNRSLELQGPVLDAMGEMIPARAKGEERPVDNGRAHLLNTLERPTTISVNASQRRLALASDACHLSLAVDTAHSWGAANSVEKMLCHQLAAVHYAAMRLFAFLTQSHGVNDRQLPPVECARLGNTAARLLEAFQSGSLTLQKLKTGGAQRVIVQRQQIVQTKDGQTLVVGELRATRRSKRKQGRRGRLGRGGRLLTRRGWLKNGNPPGDFSRVPRCGARSKRTDRPCGQPAMKRKARCRLHGGKSTGPRTPEGLARSRRANWKHGLYSQEARAALAEARSIQRAISAICGSASEAARERLARNANS